MKSVPVAIVIALFAMALPAIAMAANNTTTEQNLTPVSISQNATISVPTPSTGLALIGRFENATVYISGGANATILGSALAVDMGEASWMDYRDIYLFYRVAPGFASVSFDYDLQVGEKSNVLLVDFAGTLPVIGIKKGGIPDTAMLGLGTWTNRNSEIRGMNDIGGLKRFPQGAHHVEVSPGSGMLFMKVDGNVTAYNYDGQEKYLVIHLMVGDENSYLRGTVSNLKYEGPPLGDGAGGADNKDTKGFIIPNVTLNGNDTGAGGRLDLPGSKEQKPTAVNGTSKPLAGLNIWLALAAGAGFLIAWVIFYRRYLKR